MSHVHIDMLHDLKRRIADRDAEMAALKASPAVDIKAYGAAKRARAADVAQIIALERQIARE